MFFISSVSQPSLISPHARSHPAALTSPLREPQKDVQPTPFKIPHHHHLLFPCRAETNRSVWQKAEQSKSCLTGAEHEVRGDVEGLDLDIIHGDSDALLVVAGDEGDGLLSCAHIGAARGGHQGGQAVGACCVFPSWRPNGTKGRIYDCNLRCI